MDGYQVRPGSLEAQFTRLAAMRGSVVQHPEDPSRRAVGLLLHNLPDEPLKRLDSRPGLTAAEEFGTMHIPGSQISKRPSSLILMLDACTSPGTSSEAFMFADASLDTRLLVSRKDTVLIRQRRARPD